MNFSKHLLIALSSSAILLGACGNNTDTKTPPTDTTAAAPAAAPAAASTANDKGLELIAASDCTTCHKLNKEATSGATIGPAYSEVAAKYSPAADTTIDRLVKKVISGGSGVWGTIPMTPHPSIKPEDVKTMVTYILSLKK
jgi:cytochrome c